MAAQGNLADKDDPKNGEFHKILKMDDQGRDNVFMLSSQIAMNMERKVLRLRRKVSNTISVMLIRTSARTAGKLMKNGHV